MNFSVLASDSIEIRARRTMLTFFRKIRTRLDLKKTLCDTSKWVRHIQERFRSYWSVRTHQISFIASMITREKERLQIAMYKD